MSAENHLVAVPMENGEIWICLQRTGDTYWEANGEVYEIVSKEKDYSSAKDKMKRLDDSKSPEYHYTEYGGHMPSKSELRRTRKAYLASRVIVQVANRKCGCADFREAEERIWEIIETNTGKKGLKHIQRKIESGLTFTEALTNATLYRMQQPGKKEPVEYPLFRYFKNVKKHDCMDLYE